MTSVFTTSKISALRGFASLLLVLGALLSTNLSVAAVLTINNGAQYATQQASTLQLSACTGGWISSTNVYGDGSLLSGFANGSTSATASWNLSTPDGLKTVNSSVQCTSSYTYTYTCGSYSCNCGFWSCSTCYNYCTGTGFNYWTESAGDSLTLDTTRPTITATSPASGSTGVNVLIASITATFSEAVTVPAGSFTLDNGATGTQSYDAGAKQAIFTLSAPLANATTYTATIGGGVTDSAGNQILSPYTWSFTTPARLTVTDSVASTADHTIDFGSVTVGTTQDEIVTVYNNGSTSLSVGSIAIGNSLGVPFAIVADACSGTDVVAGGSCTITVRYAPSKTETYVTSTDSFDIPTNDSTSPSVLINLSGTGTPAPVPKIRVTDGSGPQRDMSLVFAGVGVSQTATATVTITNNGTANLVIGNVGESDPLADPYSISGDTCTGQTLVPSASCTITVSYNPTNTALVRDSFSIPSNDPNNPVMTVDVAARAGAVAGNAPPPAPLQVYPADMQVNVASPVTFLWEQAADPDGDVVRHELVVCTDHAFSGCEPVVVANADFATKTLAAGGFGTLLLIGGLSLAGAPRRRRHLLMLTALVAVMVSGLIACSNDGGNGSGATASNATQASTTVSSLSSGTTYYWKVLAIDSNGSATSSAIQSFTTQ